MSTNVCLDDIFWTAKPFATKTWYSDASSWTGVSCKKDGFAIFRRLIGGFAQLWGGGGGGGGVFAIQCNRSCYCCYSSIPCVCEFSVGCVSQNPVTVHHHNNRKGKKRAHAPRSDIRQKPFYVQDGDVIGVLVGAMMMIQSIKPNDHLCGLHLFFY